MGTRADFYIQKTEDKPLIWLGSIAWDGYDINNVGESKTSRQYLSRLKKFLDGRDDSTYPKDGWPWPWDNSKLTDCVYVFAKGQVNKYYERVGHYDDHTTPLRFCPFSVEPLTKDGEPKKSVRGSFTLLVPDMKDKKNVRWDKGSGIIVIHCL